MTQLHTIGPGLDPDDLWRNHFYLESRLKKLEALLQQLCVELQELQHEVWEFEADEDKLR